MNQQKSKQTAQMRLKALRRLACLVCVQITQKTYIIWLAKHRYPIKIKLELLMSNEQKHNLTTLNLSNAAIYFNTKIPVDNYVKSNWFMYDHINTCTDKCIPYICRANTTENYHVIWHGIVREIRWQIDSIRLYIYWYIEMLFCHLFYHYNINKHH